MPPTSTVSWTVRRRSAIRSPTPRRITELSQAGHSWRSYQEDVDLDTNGSGHRVNLPLPRDKWTVPIASFSGTFAAGVNLFNGSPQFNYAAKHNPMVFFTDTNGGNDSTPANPLAGQYAPLQQLFTDLQNNAVAEYNWITPNQFNDMHTTLANGFQGLTGDAARILQGDNFLQQIIPTIMASDAYKNHGMILVWWDESEKDGASGDNQDRFDHTVPFIVISQDVHPNVGGRPYASQVNFTHSSFLRSMQQIFGVGPLLGDAANATDPSDLFKPGRLHESPASR